MNAPPLQIPCTGGVNLLNDARTIRDDQCVRAKNLYPVKPGLFAKRPAMSYDSPVGACRPHAVYFPPQSAGYYALVAGMQANTLDGLIATVMGGGSLSAVSTITHATGQGYGHVIAAVPYNDQLLVFVGNPQNVNYEVAASGTITARTFNGAGNAGLSPKVACTYQRRFVYGNFGERKDAILFSDVDDPWTVGDDAMAANGRWVQVGDGAGDEIIAMHEVALQAGGSPLQTALLVLMKRSCHLFVGQPNETDDTGDLLENLQATRLNIAAGCVSPATLADTPFGTMWCGEDDVWLLPYGGLPTRIGTNLQPLLKSQPQGGHYKIFAAFHDGFYRLALFDPEQETREQDAPQGHYWLDLRLGFPQSAEQAQWWGPMRYYEVTDADADYPRGTLRSDASYGPWALVKDVKLGPNAPLLSVNLFSVTDGYMGGTTLVGSWCASDNDAVRDSTTLYSFARPWQPAYDYVVGDFVVNASGTIYTVTTAGTSGIAGTEPDWADATETDNTVVWTRSTVGTDGPSNDGFIWFDLVTKEYDLGDPYTQKLFIHGEIDALISSGTRLVLDVLCDGGRETTTIVDNMMPAGSATGDALSLTLSRQFNRERLNPSAGARPLGNTIQLRISDVGGYVIDDTNNGIRFYRQNEDDYLTTTIAVGWYATYTALLNAIVTAVNAALVAAGDTDTISVANYSPVARLDYTGGSWAFVPATAAQSKLANLVSFTNTAAEVSHISADLVSGGKSPTQRITFASPTVHLRPTKRRPT